MEHPKAMEPETESRKIDSIERAINSNDSRLGENAIALLQKILVRHPELANITVEFISTSEEPYTGGVFDVISHDEYGLVPIIYIVEKEEGHLMNILKTRQGSIEIMAKKLGIAKEEVTIDVLQNFILSHELGHAYDFIKNYQETNRANEWTSHYESNLAILPVPGIDPVDLRNELSLFKSIDEYYMSDKDLQKNIERTCGYVPKTQEELLALQEKAYRQSPFELYADDFAVKMLTT